MRQCHRLGSSLGAAHTLQGQAVSPYDHGLMGANTTAG